MFLSGTKNRKGLSFFNKKNIQLNIQNKYILQTYFYKHFKNIFRLYTKINK